MSFLEHFSSQFSRVGMEDIENFQKKNEILLMFSDLFKKMNPSKYPGFTFAWVELISSPWFMPIILSSSDEYNTRERWFKMQELLNELFEFLKQNLYENCKVTPSLDRLFEGIQKLCLVILHDFPEFFCYYYFEFINHLPLYQTGKLRNMILAAYPKDMKLPDPSAEITSFPKSKNIPARDRQTLLKDYIEEAKYYSYKDNLDKYLETENDDYMRAICRTLEESQVVKNDRKIINTGIVHSTILYLAHDIENKKTVAELEDPKLIQKFYSICKMLSTPVRDILLNNMFDELRLLNKTTVFFMNVLLNIFRMSENETMIRSQISRILIERMMETKINVKERKQDIQHWGLLAFKIRISKEPGFQALANTPPSQS